MKIIFSQLIVKNINKKLYNQFLYLKNNKTKTAKQLLIDIKIKKFEFEIIKEKTQNKTRNMVVI